MQLSVYMGLVLRKPTFRILAAVGYRRLAASVALAVVSALAVVAATRLGSGVSAEFVATSLVVAAIPGTGLVYTVSSAIGGGRRRGLFAAIGCTLGVVPHMLAAMLGLSGIMQAGAVAFETVRWAGVAYLVWMGVSLLRDGDGLQLDQQRVSADSAGLVCAGQFS